jgi:cellulose synthase/poly-beta-1,6-N-acetylglucosamine synthase-like glycosyltransferase
MDAIEILLISLQVLIGYNLVLPAFLFLIWKSRKVAQYSIPVAFEPSYAIVVTAYEQIDLIPAVIDSILKLNYSDFIVYIVADKCDTSSLNFVSEKVVLLKPPVTLASNTRSHQYAIEHFVKKHDYITIIDSDNLVHKEYLNELNKQFSLGYKAVQGIREAKNLNTSYACLDAARDLYYHYYDGKLLFELGSSSTLSGSGMAFELKLYQDFLKENDVKGAGFDKVLQAWIVEKDFRISFAGNAIVYDEKTSASGQLVQQRSRWINTWFKYFRLGFRLIKLSIANHSKNQFFFGLIVLRPPLFIFLLLSLLSLTLNLIFGYLIISVIWLVSWALFIGFFLLSLYYQDVDPRIISSLRNIPKFIFFQILSLINVRKANRISVATKHQVKHES